MPVTSDGEPEAKRRKTDKLSEIGVDGAPSEKDRHLSPSNEDKAVDPLIQLQATALRGQALDSPELKSSLPVTDNALSKADSPALQSLEEVLRESRKSEISIDTNTLTTSTQVATPEATQTPVKRGRGRPPKSSRPNVPIANDKIKVENEVVERRRSDRFNMTKASQSIQPVQSSPEAEKPANVMPDTRKHNANGRPRGRPRKYDGAMKEVASVKKPRAIEESSALPGSNDGCIDTRKKSASGKPLGRPRQSDLRTPIDKSPSIGKNSARLKQKLLKQESSTSALDPPKSTPMKGPKKFRLRFGLGPAEPIITNPFHIPPKPVHTDFEEYLNTFISLDEDVTPEVASQRRTAHLMLQERVRAAERRGALAAIEKPKDINLRPTEPRVPQSHLDHLNSQANYFSKLMQDERRRNYSNARKIAGMIHGHFKKLSGAEERQLLEDQRALRLLAKRTAHEIRRKWKLAEKEVQRRINLRIQEEQRAAGKEHLNQILEHSTNLLDAQVGTNIEHQSFSDAISDNDEDHYLSVEALREKYSNLPELDIAAESDVSTRSESDVASHESHLHGDRSGARESGSDHSDLDDSPMDSELESDDNESEVDDDESETPGLASLYPELGTTQESRDSDSKLEEVNVPSLISHTTTNSDNSVSNSRKAGGDLVALPSDEDSDEDLNSDNDSPMDSELDETDTSETGSEGTNGPGLTWLYNTPLSEPAIREPASEQIKESPTNEPSSQVVNTKPVKPEKFTSAQASPDLIQRTNEDSPVVDAQTIQTTIPFLLRGVLREYQHLGLNWMAGLYLSGTNGILADEMGLGKTIQTISLLTWLACEKEIWGTHLIVVPTSVMLNWEMEFKKFAPALKVLTYYGSPKERKEKRRGWSRPDTVHVVITSYQLVITDAAVFRRKPWQYLILDEAHNIKNFKSQRWQTLLNFNSQHRLLLTGTPLQNNLNELWSLLYFLMPQGLSNNASFASLSDFQEWFARPVDKLIDSGAPRMDDEARHTVAKLHRILRPYILRRLKADVEKQMPGKYEHIVTCRLSKRQRFLYDDFMSRSGTRAIMASGNFLSIINCFMQLRKVCNHPDLFESRPVVTSFAVRRSAVATFEIEELLIRRRLLAETRVLPDLDFLNLRFVKYEGLSKPVASRISELSAAVEVVVDNPKVPNKFNTANTLMASRTWAQQKRREDCKNEMLLQSNYVSALRCARVPVYGSSFVSQVRGLSPDLQDPAVYWQHTAIMKDMNPTIKALADRMHPLISRFACITPKAVMLDLPDRIVALPEPIKDTLRFSIDDAAYFSRASTSIAFPDKRLLQFDCGKLQKLDHLLRTLISGGHRVLIFTQMTKMLDILEQFLNIHGHRYFRLDGSTKIENRQSLTERFNTDKRIPVFILSTRSGGLGINLTGADTVIFYDSDWNPCMDRQCQDRAHRIGQTRDVHIYRFVSEFTIEQNIMRKADQKRMLDNVVIGEGDFTTDFFNKVDWKDMLGEEISQNIPQSENVDLEGALAAAEDEDDAQAAQIAQREMDVDAIEFAETGIPRADHPQATDLGTKRQDGVENDEEEEEEEEDPEMGSIDNYMIQFLEREMGVSI